MCKHFLDRPGFRKRLRAKEGFRMWRLAGGERSTRFEPASQHSQLPLLRTRGHSSNSTFHASVCVSIAQVDLNTSSKPPIYARGPIICSGRTHSSNCSFVNSSSSRADSRNVMPFSCAFFAIFAALSYPIWLFNAVTNMSEFSR